MPWFGRFGRLICLVALVARPCSGAAGVQTTVDFVSQYVFRGASQRQGASIQPTITYRLVDTLKLSLWSNVRLANAIAFAETDYAAEWTWLNASPASLTLGAVHYDRGRSVPLPTSTEVYAGVDFAKVPGQPALYLWYDLENRPGLYWDLSAAHRFLLPDYRGTVDVGLGLGFDTGRINGFHDARLSVGFTREVGDWRLRPSVDLHFPAQAIDPGADGLRPVFRFSATRSF